MKKRSIAALTLAILTPLLFSGCLFFESGGSPTDPDDDKDDRPDDENGDDITLEIRGDFERSPLDGFVYFV